MSAPGNDGERPSPHVQGQGIQVGDGGRQYNLFGGTYIEKQVIEPVRPAPARIVVGSIPQAPPAFQAREDLVSQLRAAGPGAPMVRAVTGMRGVGKTQIAAAYARECVNDGWRLVAWINAETLPDALGGLAQVAVALGIEAGEASTEEVGRQARSRLEADGDRCLVVFDNVTGASQLLPYVPAAGQARVVLTSTSESTASLGHPLAVGVFTARESLAFLASRTQLDDPAGARELAAELGGLPLGLAQAAAVMTSQRLTYPVYLDRLRSFPLLEYLSKADGEGYPRGLAEAILLSVNTVMDDDRTGLCGLALDVISLLSAGGVSRDVLRALGRSGTAPGAGSAREITPATIDDALGRLAGASLATFGGAGDIMVSAHRLVTRVVRERCAHEGTLIARGARACALLGYVRERLGEPWQDPPAAREFFQHVSALDEHLTPCLGDRDTDLATELLSLRRWAYFYIDELRDSAADAVQRSESLLAAHERLLGGAHLDTVTTRSNLAYAYQLAGRYAEAIPLFESALADRERLLGGDDPDTVTSQNNLAGAYQMAGHGAEAIELFERTLADRVRVLGEEHPDTLMSRNNLAWAYSLDGRVTSAIPLYERTLADRERVLGRQHPETLSSRNNLAAAYYQAGRLDEAIALYEQTLAACGAVLGDRHPNTQLTRYNLADAYRSAGRLAEAIPLLATAVATLAEAVGEEHPDTVSARQYLALASQELASRRRGRWRRPRRP